MQDDRVPEPARPAAATDPLRPRDGALYVVRWVKGAGREVTHRYFRRPYDAEAFAAKMRRYGKKPAVYYTASVWDRVL